MNQSPTSGFTRAVDLVSFVVAVIAAFIWLPEIDATTRNWVVPHIMAYFGAENLGWLLFCWQACLALLIYAVVRGGLGLSLSMLGLIIALIIAWLFGRGPRQ